MLPIRILVLLSVFLAVSLAAPKNVYGTEKGIPILMMHRFSSSSNSLYNLKPLEFKRILETLNTKKYCLIDLLEYTNATFMKRCAGKKPFAISFDDGHASQFRFLKNGLVDPTSGLGVLLSVFPNAKATFFLNVSNGGTPFGTQSQAKITWLRKNGFTIGNHTVSHPILSKLSQAAVIQEIDGVCNYLGVPSMILAYPYGLMPAKPIPSYKTKCRTSAAFRAWLGYFEAHKNSGALLAPLPNTKAFSSQRFSYPRLNIHSYTDFKRDILLNTAWTVIK
jgi:peptidoglycan/xylan/chitin deacetylase (PgdA/CDA1 family)